MDTQFVGAMGPPGGGRNPVTARLLRHFNFLSFTEMSDSSVSRIFTTILGAFFKCVRLRLEFPPCLAAAV